MEDEGIAIGYLCCLGSFLGSLGFFPRLPKAFSWASLAFSYAI